MQSPFLKTVLDALDIRYDSDFVKKLSDAEPFGNSLFSLSIMLRRYHVPNDCLKIEPKGDILQCGSDPFVVIYKGNFVVAMVGSNGTVRMKGRRGVVSNVKADEFLKNWDGVALIPYPDADSKEPDYTKHRRVSRINYIKHWGLIAFITFIVILAVTTNSMAAQWMWWCVLLIDFVGTGVCFMLLQKELHIRNHFADKICRLAKESRCGNVTNSDGGTLFGILKLSELGFTYFAVNSLYLLFYPASISVISLTAVAVLPFSFWSVWYQKYKVKSWCVLCLCSLAAMWLQALVFLLGGEFSRLGIELMPALWLLSSYGFMLLLVDKIMAYIKERQSMKFARWMYGRLKYDSRVINAIIGEKTVIDVSEDTCSSIIFGNPDADSQITVFSNPYCGPCATMHEHIKDLPGSTVGIRYVFTYFSEDQSDINKYIIAAYRQLGADKTWQLLTDWYDGGKKSGKEFFAGMDLDPEASDVISEFEKQSSWRKDDHLAGTPTIIVNGRILDRPYNIDDYPYISI